MSLSIPKGLTKFWFNQNKIISDIVHLFYRCRVVYWAFVDLTLYNGHLVLLALLGSAIYKSNKFVMCAGPLHDTLTYLKFVCFYSICLNYQSCIFLLWYSVTIKI